MLAVVGAGGLLATAGGGCAQAVTEFPNEDPETTAGGAGPASSSSQGGAGGDMVSSSTGMEWPCGIDCASIATDDCHEAVCNMATKQCEVQNAESGTGCEDGLFCTVNDACLDGVCESGSQNDCGISAPACSDVICDEDAKSCTTAPSGNGAPCTPDDLCQVNATCQNGLCTGIPKDCFFAPVPDDCHVAECNLMTGMCEPVPGNEGQICVDPLDVCTVNKTCTAGVCLGGMPKDCSQLTVGCNLGVCDMMSGQCTTQAVMEGQMCDDLDACTLGETCTMGQCINGTAITQCVNMDGCCPMGCTEQNDDDCSCSQNLALMATGALSSGGSGQYGPINWNDGKKQQDCQSQNCSGCFGWVNNTTSPTGAWVEYSWNSAQQIGSMYVDANPCSSGCYNGGRTMFGGEVQYWTGAQWVTAQTFTANNGDLTMQFSPKLNTTKIRIFNITAGPGCGQASNTLIYEWYVWPGTNCSP